MTCAIHLNDVGTEFQISLKTCAGVAEDITTATLIQVVLQKPDFTKLTNTVVASGDPTEGIVIYTTILGDLDQVGKYKLQAIVTYPTGKWSSEILTFKVVTNL